MSAGYRCTRLAAMLYVGRNDDERAYVRLDASPATWSNGTNGDHSTIA